MAKLIIKYTTYGCGGYLSKLEEFFKEVGVRYEDRVTRNYSFPNGVSYSEGKYIVEGTKEQIQKIREKIWELNPDRWDYITERSYSCVKGIREIDD
jgi:hypothetical protein